MYGISDINVAANDGIYKYEVSAKNKGGKRVITIKGYSKETRNRLTTATITVSGRDLESILIAKSANTFWGWRTVFSDSCLQMKRIK
jgi:O-glycosyl hydrolase